MARRAHQHPSEQELRRLQEAAASQPGVKELLQAHQRHERVLDQVSFVTRDDSILISTYSDSTS